MDDSVRVARKLTLLKELGLTSVDSAPLSSESVKVGWRRYKTTTARPSMGTLLTITTLCPSRKRAEEAVGRTFEEIDRLVSILSRHDPSTALAHLNVEGSLDGIPPELQEVVTRALHYNTLSAGTFDISVKPLVDLFETGMKGENVVEPTQEEIRAVLELTGSENIELTERSISFRREGMGITLDGIAKGYIVDRAAEVLREYGIKSFLINAGGDIRTAGRREDGKQWAVAVQDPSKSGIYPDIIHLADGAVATSGSYEIYFDPEMRFHHIVDRSTGQSPDLKMSVSVTAPSTMAADALATALFVMDSSRGTQLIDSLEGYESMIIDRDGGMLKTKGWGGTIPQR